MSNKQRILMGVPSKRIRMGGPTTHLPYLVEYFQHNDEWEIRTFDYGSKIDGGSLIDKKESTIRKVFNTIGVFINFVRLVIGYRPHIIHINTAFDRNSLLRDIPFSLFGYLTGKKIFFKLHGSSNELMATRQKKYRLLIRLFLKGAAKVGVLSELERDEFVASFGHPEKVLVVKNIVSPLIKSFNSGSKYIDKQNSGVFGIFVSRLVEGKGLSDYISALPLILDRYPGFKAMIAGDGPEKETCMRKAERLNVHHAVTWLGYVPNHDLPLLFEDADIFFFLSHHPEGMPMALVDAMKCGMPLVTTKVRFAVNYLTADSHCLFVEAGDIAGIAEAAARLIDDGNLRQKMRIANTALVKAFSQEKVGQEFETVYNQMLNSNRNSNKLIVCAE